MSLSPQPLTPTYSHSDAETNAENSDQDHGHDDEDDRTHHDVEEEEEDCYSEEFEHDTDGQTLEEVEDPSPPADTARSRNQHHRQESRHEHHYRNPPVLRLQIHEDVNEQDHDASSEDAILVYKSPTGPRLTIQPKGKKRTEEDANNNRGAGGDNNNNRPPPFRTSKIPQSTVRNQHKAYLGPSGKESFGNNNRKQQVVSKRVTVEGTKNEGYGELRDREIESSRKASRKGSQTRLGLVVGPKARLHGAAGASSSTSLVGKSRDGGQYGRVTGSTLCQGLRGKVPGSTNVSNRNFIKGKDYAVVPYGSRNTNTSSLIKPGGAIAQRVASARRSTLNDLRNKVSVFNKEIEDLKKENRCLKNLQSRQTAALKRWEGRDAELPKLLQSHKEEIKATQIQLKKTLSQNRELEEKVKQKDKLITKMESDLQIFKTLAKRDDLKERKDLQDQVQLLSTNLSSCEKKIRQYMRHIEIMENNHKHQISAEKQKVIKSNNHALELRQEITGLKFQLKEKERMLNYVQMRSTGRSLMKSYQEKERAQQAKLLPTGPYGDQLLPPIEHSFSPRKTIGLHTTSKPLNASVSLKSGHAPSPSLSLPPLSQRMRGNPAEEEEMNYDPRYFTRLNAWK